MNSFKDRIKELRIEKNYTQLDIAQAVQVSESTYANWEQGRREPNIDGIIRLCNFFGVTAGYLIGLENFYG
ncbi:MAG: helix-turn-helix domain-containing protein [Firmicutes bacterium]|nr:helix-turn-helix domain-containing protein [Bacillota bacterium]